MNLAWLKERLHFYHPANTIEQEHVLQEILQYIILASLSKDQWFEKAEFQGGTFLRIFYHIDRFSEDLDFVLKRKDTLLDWTSLNQIKNDCANLGIALEIIDQSEKHTPVRKAMLKTQSFGQLDTSVLPHPRDSSKAIKIKLEVDTNPPAGSQYETHYLHFPVLCAVTTQTLPAALASKSHALLCRPYTKGRDWYDFIWYVSRNIKPHFPLLQSAIDQSGPWKGQGVKVSANWYLEQLSAAVAKLDINLAKKDVSRFLKPEHQAALKLWDFEFFQYHLRKLKTTLIEGSI